MGVRSFVLSVFLISQFDTVYTERSKRIFVSDPDFVHSLELRLQQIVENVTSLRQENIALNHRVAELEQYRSSRRACETGSESVSSITPKLQLPITHHVTFVTPFRNTPKITTGITELDVDAAHNLRVNVEITSPTSTGFDITFSDWADSDTYVIKASWIACPDE